MSTTRKFSNWCDILWQPSFVTNNKEISSQLSIETPEIAVPISKLYFSNETKTDSYMNFLGDISGREKEETNETTNFFQERLVFLHMKEIKVRHMSEYSQNCSLVTLHQHTHLDAHWN